MVHAHDAALIGARLRAAREAVGKSLAWTSRQTNHSKSALGDAENGIRRPTADLFAVASDRFVEEPDGIAEFLLTQGFFATCDEELRFEGPRGQMPWGVMEYAFIADRQAGSARRTVPFVVSRLTGCEELNGR
ncbi:helix-turn-helix domain-containing protein [Nocardia sp. NPDC003979]